MSSQDSKVTIDHGEIRKWAEQRCARPSMVKSTAKKNDPGILRFDFPGFAGRGKLEEISWNQFFRKFEEKGLALVYQERTAKGKRSNFNKLVSRETVGRSRAEKFRKSA